MTHQNLRDKSLFVRRIKERLGSLTMKNGCLRVSVADDSVWELSDAGDQVLVRWVCWNFEDGDQEVTSPEFEVLSDKVTKRQLEVELPRIFSDINVVVDSEITIPSD